MRHIGAIGTGTVLSAMLFASCTCHEQVAERPAFQEPPSGFHAAQSPGHAQAAPTLTPEKAPPQEVAAAPTETPAAQIPEDFPKEVPIYKDAAVAQVQSLANNAHNVIFSTAAPVADVSAFYHQQLTQSGWRVTQEFSRGNHSFMSFQKGNMITNVTVAEDIHHPGKQFIAIMYEEQKPLDFDEF